LRRGNSDRFSVIAAWAFYAGSYALAVFVVNFLKGLEGLYD